MTLLHLYLAGLILGGAFLVISLLFGGGDVDIDLDADVDVDVDADADVDGDAEVDHAPGALAGAGDIWLPFTSLRFWIFFFAFFGLTGVTLSLFGLATSVVTLVVALAMGGASGVAAAYAVRRLKGAVGEVVTAEQLIGHDATVLLPVSRSAAGKVRVAIQGQAVDLRATTEDEAPLAGGKQVLVIGSEAGELRVTHVDALDR